MHLDDVLCNNVQLAARNKVPIFEHPFLDRLQSRGVRGVSNLVPYVTLHLERPLEVEH